MKVGFNKAKVAVARKLAIILFGMWRDGTHFQFKAETVEPHRQMSRRPAPDEASPHPSSWTVRSSREAEGPATSLQTLGQR